MYLKEELELKEKKSNIQRTIKRVCAVHDLSGFGRVSLTEIIPCLAALGVEVCPLPTAVLSTHTYSFTSYSFLDLTSEMRKFIDHWKFLGVGFDAVYTGYIGSREQFEIISDFIADKKRDGAKIIVDPVLGDNILEDCESVHSKRMPEVMSGTKKLVSLADVITPNFTEVSLLLDIPYEDGIISDKKITAYLKRLSDMGPGFVAATGIMTGNNEMSTVIYDRKNDKVYKIDCGYVDRIFHGTGDIFASVLTGIFVKGGDFLTACRKACGFVRYAIGETLKHPELETVNGVCFEQGLSAYFSGGVRLPDFKEL